MKIRLAIRSLGRELRTHEQVCAGAALKQEAADQRLERLWRARVAANVRARNIKKGKFA